MKIFSTTIFIMQLNTWKYFPFWKIAFLENIYFSENILRQPNTALIRLKRVGHAEGRRKLAEEKEVSCTKVKACVLAFIVTWCEACGRKKRRKRWRNKRRLFGHLAHKKKRRVKKWSPSDWDWGQCSLEELCEWEHAKEKKKNIESKRKLWEIHSEKESSVWI